MHVHSLALSIDTLEKQDIFNCEPRQAATNHYGVFMTLYQPIFGAHRVGVIIDRFGLSSTRVDDFVAINITYL